MALMIFPKNNLLQKNTIAVLLRNFTLPNCVKKPSLVGKRRGRFESSRLITMVHPYMDFNKWNSLSCNYILFLSKKVVNWWFATVDHEPKCLTFKTT